MSLKSILKSSTDKKIMFENLRQGRSSLSSDSLGDEEANLIQPPHLSEAYRRVQGFDATDGAAGNDNGHVQGYGHEKYQPHSHDPNRNGTGNGSGIADAWQTQSKWTRFILPMLLSANLALFGFNSVSAWYWQRSDQNQFLVYSPLQSAVRYVPYQFKSGFGPGKSEYQGEPTPEKEKLWTDLYNFGVVRLSTEEARPLANTTMPIPGEEGGYIVQISVWHNMHCLNQIRKALWGGVDWEHPDTETLGIDHLDHCVESLRQHLMCNADIAPLSFVRQHHGEPFKAAMEAIHTCKDYEALKQWGLDHTLQGEPDNLTVVNDDPLGWGRNLWSPPIPAK